MACVFFLAIGRSFLDAVGRKDRLDLAGRQIFSDLWLFQNIRLQIWRLNLNLDYFLGEFCDGQCD